MAKIVVMPKMGFNMEEGTVIAWKFNVGDAVKRGEVIAEIETDKTVVNYESEFAGVLLKILVEEGETVPVVTPIAIMGEAGEDIRELAVPSQSRDESGGKHADSPNGTGGMDASPAGGEKHPPSADGTLFTKEGGEIATSTAGTQTTPTAADGQRNGSGGTLAQPLITPRGQRYLREQGLLDLDLTQIRGTGYAGGITEKDIMAYVEQNKTRITPLADKIAQDMGVDVSGIQGSGVRGKITKQDVISNIPEQVDIGNGAAVLKEVPYTGMRKVIGNRLSQSKFTAPHLYFTTSVDMEALFALREQVNKTADTKISVNDFVVAACVIALQNNPEINASLQGDKIVQYKDVNIGVAVAIDNGLIVPVVKKAQEMKLSRIAKETKALSQKARDGQLLPDEYQGGTFTISNLGMFGIGNFTAIINPPESAILSVSAAKWTPVAEEQSAGSAVVVKRVMNMTLSVDHRLIDGLTATKFLMEVQSLLEAPFKILL